MISSLYTVMEILLGVVVNELRRRHALICLLCVEHLWKNVITTQDGTRRQRHTFAQRRARVRVTGTWKAAVVGHPPRTLILHRELGLRSGRRNKAPLSSARLSETSGFHRCSSLGTRLQSHRLASPDDEWPALLTVKTHRARCADEPSHWRPHTFILVTTGKPQHCAHGQTRPVGSVLRAAGGTFASLCRLVDTNATRASYVRLKVCKSSHARSRVTQEGICPRQPRAAAHRLQNAAPVAHNGVLCCKASF